MGFHVDYDGLDQLYSDIFSNVNAWNSSLVTLSGNVKGLVSSSNMTGIGADGIKAYFDSVHNTIIPVISRLITAHANNCLLYIRNYQSGIDTSLHTVMDEDELEQIKKQLSVQFGFAGEINSGVQRAIGSISDIVNVSCPGFDPISDNNDEIQTLIEKLLTNIKMLEDDHYQNDFVDTSQLITTLKAFISERLGDSRSYKSDFSVESFSRSSSFIALAQACVAVNAQIEANQDAVLQAIKDENNRINELAIEARQKEANVEKWVMTGLCVVGSIAAIAVIVGTGGTATPLVVGAVSAVSGAVIAANNAAAEEYVEYGWDVGHWDMMSIGSSAVLGGISGFITGCIGAGVSEAISNSLILAGNTLVNSSSMIVRVGANAVIGSASEVVAGIPSRGITTFVTTMIVSEGNALNSLDAALSSAFDGQQMLIDGAIGGAAGGIKGIKKPTPIRSESDIIEDGKYIKNGKQNGRPTPSGKAKLEMEQMVYDAQIKKSGFKDGLLHDPNTGEILDWKPGDKRLGVIDFGHKTGLEYNDMFEKYKYGEISLDELKEFQYNANNFQIQAPSPNRQHTYEAPDIPVSNQNAYVTDSISSVTRITREEK